MANDNAHLTSREPRSWDLANIPPENHKDVGGFVWQLLEQSKSEKERLQLHQRWLENHRMFRGHHWQKTNPFSKKGRHKISLGIFFANVTRTVANITSKEPAAEVHDADGYNDQADVALSQKLQSWYGDTEQGRTLERSVLNMELYGPTFEKYIWDPDRKHPDTVVLDPFAAFPATGYYESVDDMPYFIHAFPMRCEEVEQMFNLDRGSVMADDVYSMLGKERQEDHPVPSGTRVGSTNMPGNYSSVSHPGEPQKDFQQNLALVAECWIRDYRTRTETDYERDPNTGELYEVERKVLVYPGSIRKITVTNRGDLTVDDRPNPNINHQLPDHQIRRTYLYNALPFAKACSYEDSTDIWGFSAYEQTRDLILAQDELLSRMLNHLNYSCNTPWIIPKDTGIPLAKINNRPGLVLQPANHVVAQGIRRMEAGELPRSTFEVFNTLTSLFDRVWAIENMDRGEEPNRVVAASAIQMLQERNAVLIRQKVRAVDYLVRQRGRAAISFYQSFGTRVETVNVNDEPVQMRGIDLVGREFAYVVESGSTFARSTTKTQEDAVNLYKMGAIDRQALLSTLKFPGWRDVIERTSEGQVGQALDILTKAGLPQDVAQELHSYVMQPGQGVGGSNEERQNESQQKQGGQLNQATGEVQGETPKAQQGEMR